MTDFDPIEFLEAAVQIPSHEDVGPMRSFLIETLSEHGVQADVDEAGNAIATRGVGEPHVVLNTHVDTVPPRVPFERTADRILGRGSCDAKGPLAALLYGFLSVDPTAGSVTLAVTPDEETLSTGAAALDIDADGYVVGEPTGLDVCNAAKGRFQGTVTLGGVSAHAAEPEDGVNTISAIREVIDALETFDERSDAPDPHPELGPPTLTPTVVEGGEATNQVPAECTIVVDRRSVPPETSEAFERSLSEHLREHVPDDVEVAFELTDRESPFLGPFETPADDRLVRVLQSAAGGDVRPFTAATEASYFARDASTVVFGPGVLADEEGAVAHGDREYVPVAEVEAAAEAVETTLETVLY